MIKAVEVSTIRTEDLPLRTFWVPTTEYLPRNAVEVTVTDRNDHESILIEPIIEEKISNPEDTRMQWNEIDLADTYETDDKALI